MRSRHWLVPALTAVTLASAAIGGCGQTGSLYLPDKDGEVVSSKADTAAADTSITVVPAGDAAVTPAVDPAADAEAARKRAEQRQPAPQ